MEAEEKERVLARRALMKPAPEDEGIDYLVDKGSTTGPDAWTAAEAMRQTSNYEYEDDAELDALVV